MNKYVCRKNSTVIRIRLSDNAFKFVFSSNIDFIITRFAFVLHRLEPLCLFLISCSQHFLSLGVSRSVWFIATRQKNRRPNKIIHQLFVMSWIQILTITLAVCARESRVIFPHVPEKISRDFLIPDECEF